MNFQTLVKVEPYQKYLDIAFNAAKKRAEAARAIKAKDNLSKSKRIEEERIAAVRNTLKGQLGSILKSFPSLENLPEFYLEMVKITIDYPQLKKSLGAVNWALKKADFFFREYLAKIRKTREIRKVNEYRRGFYGRVSSVLKQIRHALEFLEESRKIMKDFPTIKTSLKTVCIFGFPNVGKSTLLAKITGSRPEIKNYAFTTKRLNIGYLKTDEKKIQFIDTPGTLNRFEKMNALEQQAYLALKHCCNLVVYIFDLTESYPLEKQLQLYENLKKQKPDTPILVYISKTDMLDKKTVEDKLAHFKIIGIDDKDEVIDEIMKRLSQD